MAEQTEFSCVSCETTFDPSPNGGFCPNCDTPHPDYEAPSSDDADGSGGDGDEAEAETGGEAADADDSVEVEYAEGDEGEADADDAEDDEVETDADDAAEDEDDDGAEVEADDDGDETEADDPATIECQSCDSTVDASAAFCPNCGTELEDDENEADDDESVELTACPDCGKSIDEEAFCPGCGTNLDAIRESGAVDDADDADADAVDDTDDADADDADDADAEDAVPEEVTLEIDGEQYTFGDGDVFGRRDEEWLADLVAASGGREEARYLSGDHLEFSVEDDGIYVTDISTNGTKLNGTAMDGSDAKLEDGDTLELADRAEIDVSL